MVDKQGNPLTQFDSMANRIGLKRARQHDPRPVVIGKGNRPLERAGGQNTAPSGDLPQRLLGRIPIRVS